MTIAEPISATTAPAVTPCPPWCSHAKPHEWSEGDYHATWIRCHQPDTVVAGVYFVQFEDVAADGTVSCEMSLEVELGQARALTSTEARDLAAELVRLAAILDGTK